LATFARLALILRRFEQEVVALDGQVFQSPARTPLVVEEHLP